MIFVCHKDRVYFYEYGVSGVRTCPICGSKVFSSHASPPDGYESVENPRRAKPDIRAIR